MEFQQIRDRLVLAALPHAVFDGWGRKTLAEAAKDAALDPSFAERAFLGGAAEAVSHLADLGDRLMVADCADLNLDGMSVTARIGALIHIRLERWSEHREALRRALAVLALPGNAGAAAKVSARTVDVMWRAAGDTAHDFSWYTKRATLAAVYGATMLYWLDDTSEGCADTWAFLDRRLADVGRVTKARKDLTRWLSALPKPRFPTAPSAPGRRQP